MFGLSLKRLSHSRLQCWWSSETRLSRTVYFGLLVFRDWTQQPEHLNTQYNDEHQKSQYSWINISWFPRNLLLQGGVSLSSHLPTSLCRGPPWPMTLKIRSTPLMTCRSGSLSSPRRPAALLAERSEWDLKWVWSLPLFSWHCHLFHV